MNLYEYVIFFVPTSKPEKPTILVARTSILARNEKHAEILAGRAVPETHLDRLDEVVIKVRPF